MTSRAMTPATRFRTDLAAELAATSRPARAAAMVAALLVAWVRRDRPDAAAFALVVAGVGTLAAWIDARSFRLPDVLVVPTIPAALGLLGVAAWATSDWPALGRAAAGAAGAAAVLLALVVARPGALGWGDVKFVALLGVPGAWVGAAVPAAGALLAMALAAAGALTWQVAAGWNRGRPARAGPGGCLLRSTAIPLGPFLLLGWVATAVPSTATP